MTETNPRWHPNNWPDDEWSENLSTCTDLHVGVARQQRLTYYSWITDRLPREMDPHSPAFAQLLGDMSADEHRHERPLLSALCIYKGGNDPGPGFWNISHHLGLIGPPKGLDALAKDRFWSQMVGRCHEFWRRR